MIQMLKPLLGALIFIGVTATEAWCAAPKVVLLPMPSRDESIETLEPNIQGMTRKGDRLILLPKDRPLLIQNPYHADGKTRDARFGALTQMKRFDLPKEILKIDPIGAAILGKTILVFDRDQLSLVSLTANFEFIAQRSLPWDTVRPPADRKGEPTAIEVSRMQAKFKAAFVHSHQKIAGMAEVPTNWLPGASGFHRFLLATEMRDFPIVTMECREDAPSECALRRACFVSGGGPITDVRGIAVDVKRRLIVLGDAANHRLLVYNFSSCFNISYERQLVLPARIKALGGVYIDEDEQLWVSSPESDDYNNASVYVWPYLAWH